MPNTVAIEMDLVVECAECDEDMEAEFSFGKLKVSRCDNCSKAFEDDDE